MLFMMRRIDIWNATRHITDSVAFFLPKNANIDQVLTTYDVVLTFSTR